MGGMRHLVPFLPSPPVVAVIRMHGIIQAQARGAALNDASLAPLIEKAFRKGKPTAVALSINSPGGSPGQSSLIAGRIRRLAEEKGIPVHAFVEDVAASGGYYIACAADHIWVDRHSITGSIGVISAGFGLEGFIERHGIDRRVHTSGARKAMLDPFREEQPEDVARLKALQKDIHEGFIDHVRDRRGDRLNEAMELFEGDIWIGAKAVETGLVDGEAHLVSKMKELYGDKTRFQTYRQRRPFWSRFGADLAESAIAGVEARAHWGRFGL